MKFYNALPSLSVIVLTTSPKAIMAAEAADFPSEEATTAGRGGGMATASEMTTIKMKANRSDRLGRQERHDHDDGGLFEVEVRTYFLTWLPSYHFLCSLHSAPPLSLARR